MSEGGESEQRTLYVFAMVNRDNGLPELVWAQFLPDTNDPPMQRGTRLLIEALTQEYLIRPAGLPWIHQVEQIPAFVAQTFRVVEVTHGFYNPDGVLFTFPSTPTTSTEYEIVAGWRRMLDALTEAERTALRPRLMLDIGPIMPEHPGGPRIGVELAGQVTGVTRPGPRLDNGPALAIRVHGFVRAWVLTPDGQRIQHAVSRENH